MRIKLTGTMLVCGIFACSLAYAQTKVDSLLATMASRSKANPKDISDALTLLLNRESNAQLETLAPKVVDRLNATASPESIMALIDIGQKVYEDRHLPVWAIQFYKEALAQAEKLHNGPLTAFALRSLALVYFRQDLLPEALKFSYESSNAYDGIHEYANAARLLYYGVSINYRSGNFANSIKDFEAFQKYYEKVPPDSIGSDLKFSMMSGWNTMGLAHRKMSNFGKSLDAFQQALQRANELQDQFWIALVNGNRGSTLFQMGKATEAIPFVKEDLKISSSFHQNSSAGFACILLSEIHISLNHMAEAKVLLDSVPFFVRHAESDKQQLRHSYARVLAKFFALTKQFEKAHNALLIQVRLGDSIRSEERFLQLAQIQAGFDLEKKENEIQLLVKNNEVQQKEITAQRHLIFGSVLFVVLGIAFLVYLFVSYRKVKRQKEIIESQREDIEEKNAELEAQSNTLLNQNEVIRGNNLLLETKVNERTSQLHETIRELDTFLYHASHDIRRPIATLLGLENVARAEKNESQLFKHVANTARDMDSMLSKLQMAYRINQPIDDLGSVDLKKLILDVSEKFESQFKNFRTEFSYLGTDVTVTTSPSLLSVAFQNIIENAIQFRNCETNSWITISVQQTEGHINVIFEDNGIGIDDQHIEGVFDLYYRGTDRSKGNGVGLYLTKKSLQKIRAEITVKSTYGKGSAFTVSIPCRR